MTISLRDKYGRLSIDGIDPVAVAALGDDAQNSLSILVSAFVAREAAEARLALAQKAFAEAEAEQIAAQAAHAKANPPITAQQAHAAAIQSYKASH